MGKGIVHLVVSFFQYQHINNKKHDTIYNSGDS